ncbi:YehR family lipoprotein [Corticicoccus populi]|uniref:YehR family lipoprotein n=1 Tax=Corticicoccus populi TaxID=1812821 RepID=A0ABW5X0G6_9STAP
MKRLLQLLAAACLVLVIAACGNNDDSNDDAATEETDTEETATEETDTDSGTDDTAEEESEEDTTVTEGETSEETSTEEVDGEDSNDSSTSGEEAGEEETAASDENMTDGQEETKTFILEQNGMTNTLEYTYVDDRVLVQTSATEATYEALGATDEESARAQLDPIVERYQNTEGITHNIDYNDTGIHETLEVDYEIASIAEVANLDGAEFEGDVDEAQFISMTQTEQQLLNSGYQLQE